MLFNLYLKSPIIYILPRQFNDCLFLFVKKGCEQRLNKDKIKISELIEYKNNAKIHTKKQIRQIANSIEEFGFNDPIEIDENNMILSGHGRYEAAKLT